MKVSIRTWRKTALFCLLLVCSVLTLFPLFPFTTQEAKAQEPINVIPQESNPCTVDQYRFNWTAYWRIFNRFVHWRTEWYNGTSWVNRNTSLKIKLSYPNETTCKITLNFTSAERGNYRFTFAINQKVLNYVEKIERYQYELSFRDVTIVFDWRDVSNIPGLQLTYGILDDYFWFRIRRDNIPANFNFILDPSTVGTSTSSQATDYSFQRKSFYANGRHWVFYSDGTNMLCKTSIDGSTNWSSATTIRSNVGLGHRFSIWFDGTYLHYVASVFGYVETYLYYRRGTPNSDGTISWSASEQTALTSPSTDVWYEDVYVSTDSGSYPWISYCYTEYLPDFETVGFSPRVTKSSTNDGTWITASGFPYYVGEAQDISSYQTSIIPLTDSRMFLTWAYEDVKGRAKIWSGSSWSATEDTSSSKIWFMCLVNQADDVHLVFLRRVASNDWRILYRRRTYGTGWGTEENVTLNVDLNAFPVLSIKTANNDLYCFWALPGNPSIIYYKKRASSGWDTSATSWISESNMRTSTISGFYQTFSGIIGLMWTQGTGSPYNVRYSFLTLIVQYSVTFYYHIGGTLLVNGTAKSNGTSTSYNSNTVLNLTAIASYSYIFKNFTYDSSTTTNNPFYLTVTQAYIVHTYFRFLFDCNYIGINGTLAGNATRFSANWLDLYTANGLSQFRFSTNNTGSWLNDTWSSAWESSVWSIATKTLTSNVGIIVAFRFYANDTSGYQYASTISFFSTSVSGGGGTVTNYGWELGEAVVGVLIFSIICLIGLVAFSRRR